MDTQHVILYLTLLYKGQTSPEQEDEIRQWLEESEENKRIFSETAALYYKLKYADLWEQLDVAPTFEHVRKENISKKHEVRRVYLLSGIAALVLVCLSIFWLMQHKNLSQPLMVAKEIQSGQMKASLTLANGEKVKLSMGQEVNVDLGFAWAVEDSLKGLTYQFKDSIAIPEEYHTLSVPRAGEYILVLADGSRVWLNSETELKFPVTFGNLRREVYLNGEAYFEVVKDTARPFVVITPSTQTTVLGTSFNVMAYQDEDHTEITLVSGVVDVVAGKRICRVNPGQQVVVDNHSLDMYRQEINVSFFTSWKDGLFDFDCMKLEELCMKLSRWYDVNFFFANPQVAEKRFTGAIKRNRSLQFMLDFVQKTSGIHFEVKGKTVTVYDD